MGGTDLRTPGVITRRPSDTALVRVSMMMSGKSGGMQCTTYVAVSRPLLTSMAMSWPLFTATDACTDPVAVLPSCRSRRVASSSSACAVTCSVVPSVQRTA